jgi:2-hydroxycyclohexanecarboxyl-CoA dehydrogenase
VIGWQNATVYAASKAGLIALAKALGRELALERIAVNAIAPSVIETPQLQVDARDAGVDVAALHGLYAERTPLGRIAATEEIAAAVAYLADFRVSALVGQVCTATTGRRGPAPEPKELQGVRCPNSRAWAR